MKKLFTYKNNDYYEDSLLDAIINVASDAVWKKYQKELENYEYPKNIVKVYKGLTVCGNKMWVKLNCKGETRIIELTAKFKKYE